MMARLLLMFVVVLATWHTTPAHAQWRVASQDTPTSLGHGASFIRKDVTGPTGAELKLVVFDSTRCTMRVVRQPAKDKAASLRDAMRAAGAIAGCNGAYFTPEFMPLGL